MPRFLAFLDGQPGSYGIAFPDCPGCTAMGSTADEALENAGAALREWMADRVAAGLPVVGARGLEALRTDPALAEDFEDGVLVSVPLLLDQGRTVRANVSLDAGLLAAIDDAARRRGVTRSGFLASAAREKILLAG